MLDGLGSHLQLARIRGGGDPRAMQATGIFASDYDALDILSQFGIVDINWYRLVRSKRPVPTLQPNVVPIVAIAGSAEQRLRPVKQRRFLRHRPRPADGLCEGGEGAVLEDDVEALDSDASDKEAAGAIDLMGEEDVELRELLDELEAMDLASLLEGQIVADAPATEQHVEEAPAPAAMQPAPSVDAPAAEPAEPQGPFAQAAGPARKGATVVLQGPGGSIAFYGSKKAFEAVCENPRHGRCVLTRSCNARGVAADGFPKSGRPVGFLSAWLHHSSGTATKEEHWAAGCLKNSWERRAGLRAAIAESGDAGRQLLSCERPQAPGEPAEPASLEGYCV